jgi:hypothetical protein
MSTLYTSHPGLFRSWVINLEMIGYFILINIRLTNEFNLGIIMKMPGLADKIG